MQKGTCAVDAGVLYVTPLQLPPLYGGRIVQCLHDFDIPLYCRHKVAQIHGKKRVDKVRVVKVYDELNEVPGSGVEVECDTVLISVGLIPENELIEMAGVNIDKKTNCPVSDEINKTSIPGLFVVGDLVARKKMQIYTAWDQAVDAADEINRRLRKPLRERNLANAGSTS